MANKDAGLKKNIRMLIVGDSLTAQTIYPNDIAILLSQPLNPSWVMLGTEKSDIAEVGVLHEGYGGWTWNAFLTKYDSESYSKTRAHSPFLYMEYGSPVLNIPRYFRGNCEKNHQMSFFFLLGINDCFHVNPDDFMEVNAKIDEVLDTAEKLLAAFHTAAPNALLAVGLPPPTQFA